MQLPTPVGPARQAVPPPTMSKQALKQWVLSRAPLTLQAVHDKRAALSPTTRKLTAALAASLESEDVGTPAGLDRAKAELEPLVAAVEAMESFLTPESAQLVGETDGRPKAGEPAPCHGCGKPIPAGEAVLTRAKAGRVSLHAWHRACWHSPSGIPTAADANRRRLAAYEIVLQDEWEETALALQVMES